MSLRDSWLYGAPRLAVYVRGSTNYVQCTEAGIKDLISYQPKGVQCLWIVESRLTSDWKSCPRAVEYSSTQPRIPQDSSKIYPNCVNSRKTRNSLQFDTLFRVSSDFEALLNKCLWKSLIQQANSNLSDVHCTSQNSWCACQLPSSCYSLTN